MTKKLLADVTDFELVESLRGKVCPACGGTKKRAQTFCGPDYFKLGRKERADLYDRLGEGYREAIERALMALGKVQGTAKGLDRPVFILPAEGDE